jgi:hypothetical protein
MRPRVELEIFAAPHEKPVSVVWPGNLCGARSENVCEVEVKRVKSESKFVQYKNSGLRTFCTCRQRTKLGCLCCVGSGDFTVCQACFAYSLCPLVFSSQEQFVCLFVCLKVPVRRGSFLCLGFLWLLFFSA